MKSVIGMFIIFAGLYLLLSSGVMDFFAQKSVLIFSVSLAFFMLLITGITLAVKIKKGRGDDNDKDTRLD